MSSKLSFELALKLFLIDFLEIVPNINSFSDIKVYINISFKSALSSLLIIESFELTYH